MDHKKVQTCSEQIIEESLTSKPDFKAIAAVFSPYRNKDTPLGKEQHSHETAVGRW